MNPRRRLWIVLSCAGWLAAMIVHVLGWMRTEVPGALLWSIFAGSALCAWVATASHPGARVVGNKVAVGWRSATRGASPPLIVIGIGSCVYVFVLWMAAPIVVQLGAGRFLGAVQPLFLMSLSANFYGLAAMSQSSALAADRAFYADDGSD